MFSKAEAMLFHLSTLAMSLIEAVPQLRLPHMPKVHRYHRKRWRYCGRITSLRKPCNPNVLPDPQLWPLHRPDVDPVTAEEEEVALRARYLMVATDDDEEDPLELMLPDGKRRRSRVDYQARSASSIPVIELHRRNIVWRKLIDALETYQWSLLCNCVA